MSMRKDSLLARKIIMGLIIAANSCMTGLVMAEPAGNALPQDGHVEYGNASISTDADKAVMNINQSSDKAVINWQEFNVGRDATVNFNQPDSAAMTLNRVVGNNMSEIYGHINANGSIILVNPNGAYFANGCEVNAAGIIVSTEDMGNNQENFINGTYVWNQSNETNANITVMGKLTASTGATASKLSYGNNKIMLIADGDVVIGSTGSLKATDETKVSGNYTVGTEGFVVEGDTITSKGTIILRADQNADDVALRDSSVSAVVGDAYGTENFDKTSKDVPAGKGESFKTAKVYLNNDKADQIQGLDVSVYYNSDIVNDVNGTSVNAIGVYRSSDSTDNPTKFTQKDYRNIGTEVKAYKAKVGRADTFNAYSLVNDVYQLQAIQDVKDIAAISTENLSATKDGYYGNLAGNYAQGTNIQAKDTENWVDSTATKVGFNPIGYIDADSNNNVINAMIPFAGNYTGNGGSNTYGIYDMNINRSNENGVGLFASTAGATISSTSMIDSKVIGQDYVGGIAGCAMDSVFDSNTTRKRYKQADGEKTVSPDSVNVKGNNDVGGIIGYATNTSTRNNTNGAYIQGYKYVGGLIGGASGNQAIAGEVRPVSYDGKNLGWYSEEENLEKGYKYGVVSGYSAVGGLVGNMYEGTVTGNKGSYSNGQVEGTISVGGIVGMALFSTISNSYNTNEASSSLGTIVTKKGDYLDKDNVMGSGTSVYGRVIGNNNTGRAVGGIAGGSFSTKLDTVYNSGNISGYRVVGGLVGSMESDSSINNAYNADNNTVYQSAKDDAEYNGFIYKNGNTNEKYTYDQNSQTWNKYSASGDDWLEISKGLSTDEVLKMAPESERLYLNRLAYRDATVSGTEQVGGLVGWAYGTTTLTNTYSAGRIKSNGSAVASLVGSIWSGYTDLNMSKESSTDGNFVVTTQNVTGKNIVKGDRAMNVVENDGAYSITDYEKPLNAASSASADGSNGVAWTNGKNQNDTWVINSTTPLLKQFMSKISVNHQYVYDGTAHNLTTDGVDNYYGGAFFTGGNGINANTESYRYDNSNLWSTQRGYYISDTSGVIITPKEINYIINDNSKTYGETTADSAFSGEFDSAALVKGDKISGNVSSKDFTSSGLNKTAGVGNYDISLNSGVDLQKFLGNNYKLANVIKGSFTVNQREVDWTTDNAAREYLTGNPSYSGRFSSEDSASKTGIIAEDAGKIPSFGQEIYSTGTGFTSEAGEYAGDIKADKAALTKALGANYKLRNNNNGTTKITQATFYYKADGVSYPEGDKNLEVPVFTGRVVNGAGIDVTQYLKGSDREALNFKSPYDVGRMTKAGRYAIYGYGVLGTNSYTMAGNPQIPENDTALTIEQASNLYETTYEGAKNATQAADLKGTESFMDGYSNGPKAIKLSSRDLTILDSGIQLDAAQVDNSIVIDKSSRADGGEGVIIKRKAVVINNATMAE